MGKRIHISETILRKLYEHDGLLLGDIAKRLGCDARVVRREMEEHGIQFRRTRVRISCEELRRLYDAQRLSIEKVAKHLGHHPKTIRRRMQECGIKVRSRSEAGTRIHIPENELRRLYEDEELSVKEIARRLGYDERTVRRNMKRYGIPIRTTAETAAIAARGYPKHDFSGDLKEKAYLLGFRLG